jgi:hypothetical protein
MEPIFLRMYDIIHRQQLLIEEIADKLEQLELTGGGSASIEDYMSGRDYARNTLVVDTNTETVYRVLRPYTSVTVEDDTEAGHLKLVGFESQVVTFSHNPTQAEIEALPDDSLVAVYSPTDTPYIPDSI